MPDELFPIKVILPHPDFQVRDQPGGTPRKIFGDVTPVVRGSLGAQLATVQEVYSREFAERPLIPAVAKVRLKEDALAKSHRPNRLLTPDSCPVIAGGTFRELFVRVTPAGLTELRRRIATDDTHEGKANISTIAEFSPISSADRLGVEGDDAVQQIARRVEEDGVLKVQLFDHQDEGINREVADDFRVFLRSIGSQLRDSRQYTHDLVVHFVSARGDQLSEIASHPGVRRASVVPRFYALRHASIPVTDATTTALPLPDALAEYPIVGIVDSGIAASCGPLLPWVADTEVFVVAAEQNREHGTFVGGLVAFASDVNLVGVADIGGPCRLLDVIAMPNHDVTKGPVGVLSEPTLVGILRDVVPRYRDRVRVWNLSLGSDDLCQDSAFSDLAKTLDDIQREYDVQFVLAAGNFVDEARTWPPQATIGERDRICAPADSVISLTVGALAHAQSLQSVVSINEPSPFSRRGPGPSYIVKPEIVQYGGNCDDSFRYQTTGVRSLDTAARVAEDIGTSFATPLASALLANVINALDPAPSMNLAKALVVHSAGYPTAPGEGDINYFGFGRPSGFDAIINSTQSSATLIFEDVLQPGHHLELDPFPFPACLIQDGKSTGRIKMTLVYTPPLDSNYGLEYCRANVSASLGTWGPKRDKDDGSLMYVRQVPPDPKLARGAYEEELVKHGFKWCPVKSYRREFRKGVSADTWRLVVELLHRAGEAPSPQPFALVVTVSGDDGQPVYDDMVTALRTYATQDLALKATVRQRIRATA